MSKLTDEEIEKRLIRLMNLEKLYAMAIVRREKLKEENKLLKELVFKQGEMIEKLKLRVEELEKMIFGRKKRKDKDRNDDNDSNEIITEKTKKQRTNESYRRPIPIEITKEKRYSLKSCPCCKNKLTKTKETIRYLEDIPEIKKISEKQYITSGYCPYCKKRVSAIPIPKQNVYLGENIKQFICHSNVIQRNSFSQTKDILETLFKIKISEGEISNILEEQAKKLMPIYHQISEIIRKEEKAHFDETTYPVQSGNYGNYAWIMASAENQNSVFRLGQTRGMGNADKLKGDKDIIGITDDYPAYKNLFSHHQLCWAHLLRKLRDLADSDTLEEEKRKYCFEIYSSCYILFQRLQKELKKPLEKRKNIRNQLIKKLENISKPNSLDCSKLRTYKETLSMNKDKYFTCLLFENVPSTNNKAERNLRHLVLKRKSSFGSKTQKGADVMSILHSVLLSLWWKDKLNFFQNYSSILKSGSWVGCS